MKPYSDPNKFRFRCPVCFIEKTSGGLGHISSQACAHMRNEHEVYEFADFYTKLGLSIGRLWREGVSLEQKKALLAIHQPDSIEYRNLIT